MNGQYSVIPLNPLHVFAVASRHKTFTAAAKELGVTQVAVSRQISVLEEYVGADLFKRSARSVKLTELGQTLSQDITPIFTDLSEAMRNLLLQERDNTINLRLYPTIANYWLLPRINNFYEKNSALELRYDTTVAPLDFRGTRLDVAIQLGSGDWSGAKSRLLFANSIDVVCTPDYAKKLELNGNFQNLENATILRSKYRRRDWLNWSEQNNLEHPLQHNIEFDSSILTFSATSNGLGIAMAQLPLLQKELDNGTLIRPFESSQVENGSFYISWPTLTSTALKTKKFIDWVLTSVNQDPEFFKNKYFT